MIVLKTEKFHANLKKCSFFLDKIVFLGFVVSAKGINVDKDKVRVIQEWLTPKSLFEVRIFMV